MIRGLCVGDAGRTAEAIELYERILADFERQLGADHAHTKVVRENFVALTHSAKTLPERELRHHPEALVSGAGWMSLW
jgi:hypothetical protein